MMRANGRTLLQKQLRSLLVLQDCFSDSRNSLELLMDNGRQYLLKRAKPRACQMPCIPV